MLLPATPALPAAADPATLSYTATPRIYRTGDDPGWAAPGLPDLEAWSGSRPREPGNWWMRTTLTLARDARRGDDLALRVYAPGAVEIYWDGSLVGGDGVIGHDPDSEIPGRHGVWAAVEPAAAAAGEHAVAVRVSSHRLSRVRGPLGILLLNRAATERREGRRTAFFLLCAGILLFAGVVFGLLYRPTGRRIDTALFATLSLLVGTLLLLEYAKFVYPYPYTWHTSRLIAISLVTGLVGVLLPVFVAAHLRIGRLVILATALSLVYIALVVIQPDPDHHSLSILRTSIGGASLLALAGAMLRRPGAPWILAAAAAGLVPIFFTGPRYADHWFFVGFLVMVAVLLLRMGRTLRRQAREAAAAVLQAERLRYELLRKTIQPHFLMNSLAVAISHIEAEPARGIDLLRDLAGELEAFFGIGERDIVPLAEELELCRKHARTMEHLLDHPIELLVDAGGAGVDIPPGVLLTLVENAITHGDLTEDPRILIRIRETAASLIIEVENRAARGRDLSVTEGAGLRFVRAQLARGPGPAWTVDSGPDDGRWRVRMARHET